MNRSVHKDTCRIWDRGVCNCGPINAAPESRDAGGATSGGQGAVDLQKVLSALEALYLHTKNNMQICGANYCAARAIEELKAAIGPGAISVIEVSIQGAPTPPADVDLPDRVIDQLMHDAGVSLMEPWSEQEMYDFANTVKREVLARVPSKMLATSPQHQVKKGEPS